MARRIAYGSGARNVIDVFAGERGNNDKPLVVFIHGGYWQALDGSWFSHMARGLNANGIAVAVAGYDLCPQVGIADIIVQMQQACLHLWRRFRRHIMVFGHSAGGHLTACLLATDWPALAPGAPADLVPTGYAISGVFDLAPLVGTSRSAGMLSSSWTS